MENKETSSKKRFSIKNIIYNDKYLIVFSLLLAVVVWTATSINIGTDESKNVKLTVPITLGDEVSEQLGMQYFSLKDSVDISVSISGPKYVIGQVTKDDLNVKFDTSSVIRTGEQTIPILVTNGSKTLDFTVESVYPSSVEGYFDISTSKTFDVEVEYDEGAVADGYIFGTPVLSEDKVVVSGPKTYIDKIESVYVNADLGTATDIKETVNTTSSIEIKGNGVEERYLTITPVKEDSSKIEKLSVALPVLKIVDLPVKVDIEDVPAGLSTSDYSIYYSQSSIKAGVLDSANITEAVIGAISFSQLKTGVNTFEFTTDNIQGVTALEKDQKITVTVTVNSNFVVQSVPLYKSSISLIGAKSGTNPTISSVNSGLITVVVPKGTVINRSDLVLKCNVSDPDNETVVIEITVNNDKSWIYGTYTATIEY
ncbi:MAG: YbbR-like domain-containing protein [Eubacterium sp.]